MENTLKETEWLTINKVLLEMYDITDIDQFTERVLKTYRMLIPYTKGYFIVFNEAGGIESEKSSFIEMEPGVYEEYLDSYYEKDYMKYTFELSEHTITYHENQNETQEHEMPLLWQNCGIKKSLLRLQGPCFRGIPLCLLRLPGM
jgi:hypothetical protein